MPISRDHFVRRWIAGLIFAASLHSAANVSCAQKPLPPSVPAAPATITDQVRPGEAVFQVVSPFSKVTLTHLDTRVLELANRIRIVDGFNAQKIHVSPLSPHRVRIRAEQPGVTTVKLIDELEGIYTVEVFVEPDTRELKAYLERLFPGTAIEVIGVRDGVVLKGWVSEPAQIPQIMAVAEQFYPPESINSQLQVGGVSQVQLNVQIVEVQRSKIRELGFNFLLVGQQYFVHSGVGSVGQISQATTPFGGPPGITVGGNSLGNEFNFAITGSNNIFQGFLKALQSEGLAKILAEPKLVTTSGRPATLLSGGEFPILVPQSLGNVTIEYREFGVRMEAVPIVLGNGRLRLDIAPEVSERDFSSAVSLNGFVVPGVTVRRVNTQVEMRFGETLMIGGLISTRRTGTTQKVPFLGELPWIGAAFSRKNYSMGETELLIMVSPQLVAPMAPHQVPCGRPGMSTDLPTDKELYFDGLLEVPLFGPDCPDCEPLSGNLITPGDMQPGRPPLIPGMPGGPPGPGGPAMPAPPVQPISGRREPGQVQHAAAESPSGPTEMKTSPSAAKPSASSSPTALSGPNPPSPGTPSLGLIPPKAAAR